MKKFIYYIITIIITLIPIYIIIGIWGIYDINKNSKNLFKSKENLIFHKEYSKKLHHLRDSGKLKNKNDYLFSIIHNEKNFKTTLLIQGDSWAEQISQGKESFISLKNFSKKNKINSFNAGTTSYAPSVMHIQFKILKKDFNINPDFLVIYIDQTDLGDEICRYDKKKVFSPSGKLISIEPESYTRATYDYTKIYEYSEMYLSNNNVYTVIKFPYIKIRYFFKRNFNSFQNIFTNGWKNRNITKCNFGQIQKELLDSNDLSKEKFKKSLVNYLNFLITQQNLKKILIVSFPHRNHHSGLYKVNVSDYIDQIIVDFNKSVIKHLNFSNYSFTENELKNMYRKGDIASHLKNEYHSSIFLKEILNKLEN